MDPLDQIEAHFKMTLPQAYRLWSDKGYFNFESGDNASYLWVSEAEWIPPAEIPTWKLPTFGTHIDGLVPFAFSGAGDSWCWQLTEETAPGEYRVLFCLHDEESATVYAPTFMGWFYRNCLEYVASIDDGPDYVDEAREYLEDWARRLVVAGSSHLADHLLALKDRKPFHYCPTSDEDFEVFGLIHFDEIKEFVIEKFGEDYFEHEIDWQMSEYRTVRATPDEVRAAQEGYAQERRIERYATATREANYAFRQGDYASYVSILEPFEDLLTPVQQKKKALAIRKAGTGP